MGARRVLGAVIAACAFAVAPAVSATAAPPGERWVTLDFDQPPGPEWVYADCFADSAPRFSGGILTIDSPSCAEFHNFHGLGGEWHQLVDNRRGWVVETRMRLDPGSAEASDCLSTLLWIHDHTQLLKIGISPSAVCLSYPELVRAPMDTTDAFHVYRVEGRRDRVKVFVDGRLVIDHVFTGFRGDGTDTLSFGDGDGVGATVSYWDYVRYTVRPGWQGTRRGPA